MIDLKPYCLTEKFRPYLAAPFSIGEFTYATNGHVLVRVPRREDAPEYAGPRKLEAMLASLAGPHGPASAIPDLKTILQTKKCDVCDGSGWVAQCEKCGGDGFIECCECGQEKDCEDCSETGHFPAKAGEDDAKICEDCAGKGVEFSEQYVALSDKNVFQVKYLNLILELPKVEIALADEQSPSVFFFEGGCGLIMGCRRGGHEFKAYTEAEAA
jgi:hypothetical protein